MPGRIFRNPILVSCLLAFTLLFGCADNKPKQDTILVFAAASLRDVMQEIALIYKQETGTEIVFNFAGSNVLARQIEAAAQADVYLSANAQWMNYLSDRELIKKDSTRQFLSNDLVFIAQKNSQLKLGQPDQLASLPFRFLSIGDPEAVPAGRYAKLYLSSLTSKDGTVWAQVKNRVLPATDVKGATSIVENMPDMIGIVYKTDALASNKVNVLYEIKSKELQIQYLAASIKKPSSSKAENLKAVNSAKFLDYLIGEEAQSVFRNYGFNTTLSSGVKTAVLANN